MVHHMPVSTGSPALEGLARPGARFNPGINGRGADSTGSLAAADAIRSISTYLVDAHTRVFNFNGRKLLTHMAEENFCGKRLSRVPTKTIEFATRQPATSALLPSRLGYFPHARGQKVSRPNGDWSYTLLFCVDGAGVVQQGDARWNLTCGMVALLRPFEFHAYEAGRDQPWSLYWVHFNGSMAAEYANLLTNFGQRTCFPIELDVRVIHTFEEILTTYHEGFSYRQLVRASALMHQMLSSIWMQSDMPEKTPNDVETRIARTIAVMKENPGSRMSIREFAAAANMSQMYFGEKFRQYTRQNPRSYFTGVKMEKASELLATTDMKVEHVAQAVGFDDAFYFSRVFKGIIGETPSGYRERMRHG
jgi:AraC family transcriptional regulator of arabinose operon